MPFVEKHFWSEVLWGSAECVGTGVDNFREPKICEFEESSVVDQNVFRLQVTMCDILRVQIVHCAQDLLHCLCSFVFSELFLANNLIEELTTLAEFCHDVQVTRILIEFVHLNDSWVIL